MHLEPKGLEPVEDVDGAEFKLSTRVKKEARMVCVQRPVELEGVAHGFDHMAHDLAVRHPREGGLPEPCGPSGIHRLHADLKEEIEEHRY